MTMTRPRTLLLAAAPLAFLMVFFVYPVLSILVRGLAPTGSIDIGQVAATLSRPFIPEVVVFTFAQAVASTLLTVIAALPAAFVFARFEFRGRRLVSALALVPFVLPTVVVAAAFAALLGPRGPFGLRLDQTLFAILLAHVFYNFAIVLRIVAAAWESIDPRLEDAARTLGATRWQAFRRVTLPLLRGAIGSAAAIVFLFTFTSFGVILILGGPTFATIEVEIYRQAVQLFDLQAAALLSLIQLAFLGVLLIAHAAYQRRATVALRAQVRATTTRTPRNKGERAFVGATLIGMAALLGLPLVMLVERSLQTGSGYGVGNYAALAATNDATGLFVPPLDAIRNSLVFAVATTMLSTLLGLAASHVIANGRGRFARALDVLVTLPLGTSAVIVGFGFLVALGSLPIDLRVSPLLIPIAHSLVALPFVVRAVVPVMRSMDKRLHEAAATLGASPSQVWRRIDVPIIGRAALVGAGFAFAVSLGEFGATLFIVRPETPTMPVAIFRMLGRPGDLAFGQAMAMATVLMVVTAAAIVLIDRIRLPRSEIV